MITEQLKICVVGLGYVGLPLAVAISNNKQCNLTQIVLEAQMQSIQKTQTQSNTNIFRS